MLALTAASSILVNLGTRRVLAARRMSARTMLRQKKEAKMPRQGGPMVLTGAPRRLRLLALIVMLALAASCAREKAHTDAYERGLEAIANNDPDLAIACFGEAIRADPKNALAYANRGAAYAAKGDDTKVIADCTEAIRLDPQLRDAYINRAQACINKAEYDRAIADCNILIEKSTPVTAKSYYNRGLAYLSKGDDLKAVADFTEAIKISPKLSKAYGNRGIALLKLKQIDLAIGDFTEAIHLAPADANGYALRAKAYRAQGDDKNAAEDERKVQELKKTPAEGGAPR